MQRMIRLRLSDPKPEISIKNLNYSHGQYNQLAYWMDSGIISEVPRRLESPVDWSDYSQKHKRQSSIILGY